MKLIEIQVKNFRSLNGENIKLSLENSNIIFILGQNNAGKSALLSAYEYLVTPKKKADLSDFFNFNPENKIEITAIFEKEESDEAVFASKGFNTWVDPRNNRLKFRKTWNSVDTEGQKETWKPNPENPDEEGFIVNGFGGLESHFNYHAPTAIRIPAFPSMDELPKWVKETVKSHALKKLKEDEAEAYNRVLNEISQLHDKIISKDFISAFSQQANKNFTQVFPNLSLNIAQIEGGVFDISKSLESEFSVIINDERCPNVRQNFNHHGHGVIRQAMFNFLGIVKNQIGTEEETAGKKFIILFEEPEVYLHPKAVKLLKNVLYDLCEQSPFQILCASHSPGLIDISKPHTSLVRLIRNSESETSLYQAGDNLFATNDDQKERVQMINRFDPNVCEAFFTDEIIMVEGDTEAIVCRELIEKINPTKDIFVLNTGSKNNIPFFQKIFNHFRIKQHIIHDSDTKFNYKISEDENGNLAYEASINKNGTQTKNSAWKLNETIWEGILEAQSIESNLAQRFVSVYNFEVANNYKYDKEKGKPLSAYEFAKNHEKIEQTSIYKFINCILSNEIDETDYSYDGLCSWINEPELVTNLPLTIEDLAQAALAETDTIAESESEPQV